jgi:hypothetical protein
MGSIISLLNLNFSNWFGIADQIHHLTDSNLAISLSSSEETEGGYKPH